MCVFRAYLGYLARLLLLLLVCRYLFYLARIEFPGQSLTRNKDRDKDCMQGTVTAGAFLIIISFWGPGCKGRGVVGGGK